MNSRGRGRRPHDIAILLLLPFALSGQTCGQTATGCGAEPKGSLVAFLEDPEGPMSVRFTGIVVAVRPPNDLGLARFVIRDGEGRERRLTYGAAGVSLPIRQGDRYDFQVDHVGGFPEISGLLIRDSVGLLFAGVSDQNPGERALKEGVPSFDVAFAPTRCKSRPHGKCYDAIYNLPLRVSRQGKSATLFHGDSTRLGTYRVTCLTAQKVIYNDRCADAGLHGVSYAITREE